MIIENVYATILDDLVKLFISQDIQTVCLMMKQIVTTFLHIKYKQCKFDLIDTLRENKSQPIRKLTTKWGGGEKLSTNYLIKNVSIKEILSPQTSTSGNKPKSKWNENQMTLTIKANSVSKLIQFKVGKRESKLRNNSIHDFTFPICEVIFLIIISG